MSGNIFACLIFGKRNFPFYLIMEANHKSISFFRRFTSTLLRKEMIKSKSPKVEF